MARPAAVLVAEDDDVLRRFFARTLSGNGYVVQVVGDGAAAIEALESSAFDLVLSDIDMPRLSGVDLLREVRRRNLDIPVVLFTGNPRLDSAMAAVELGASHYLTKPIDVPRLLDVVGRAVRAHRLARARRELLTLAGDRAMPIADLAGLSANFDHALAGVFMVYQPIVQWSRRGPFAYEALVRSANRQLCNPAALLDAAERLDRMLDVGNRVRSICGEIIAGQSDVQLFVNLHTTELLDERLYDARSGLGRHASRVVLEITERARLERVTEAARRIEQLRAIGFRIAVDDLGAGYAGLTSFVALEPDFVKLDRELVQGIDARAARWRWSEP